MFAYYLQVSSGVFLILGFRRIFFFFFLNSLAVEKYGLDEGEGEIKLGSQTSIVPSGNSNMVCTLTAAYLGFAIFQMHHV